MIQRFDPQVIKLLLTVVEMGSFRRGILDTREGITTSFDQIRREHPEFGVAMGIVVDTLRLAHAKTEANHPQLSAEICCEFAAAAERSGLRMCALHLRTMAADADAGRLDTKTTVSELGKLIRYELQLITLLIVDSEAVRFLKGDQLLGPAVAGAIPSARYDIEQVGEALALGLWTAAVFHLMRVMECALRSLAEKLGVSDPVAGDRNWGKMLDAIDGAIKTRRWSKGEEQPYRAAARFLEGVKDAWRNPVMHVEAKYDKDDAIRIFNAVATFTHQLAEVLK